MPFAEQLEATWPARFVAEHPWSFPSLEIVHLPGLTVVFGGMVLLALRLPGIRRELSITLLQRHILPLLALNAWLMHRYGQRDLANWHVAVLSPAWVRASAVLSLLMWTGVFACGRLIAPYHTFGY